MTSRLYYEDSYLTEFSATVQSVEKRGERHVAVLDRTTFYPTSGGQPHDTGTLGGARVLEVEEDDAGNVLHILETPISAGMVGGRIDWERRFDHMQQHTGQHILSQAFLKTAQAQTVSFHLGRESCTIDIELVQASSGLMQEAEQLATQIVFEDRVVDILNIDRSELGALGVRKDSRREGVIRVIDVEDFDLSPCGGTHVRRTGEIGMVAVLDFDRYKGGTRVEFACGSRVLRLLRKEHEILKALGRLHSAHAHELPPLMDKLIAERSSLNRENAHLNEQLLEFEARELAGPARAAAGINIVRRTFSGRTIESVKILAQKIAAIPGTVPILALVQDGKGAVVLAKGPNVPADCGTAIKETIRESGGKGGGRPELAQAGGIPESALESWLDSLERRMQVG